MKKIALAFALCLIAVPAFAATCPQPAFQIKDNLANTGSVVYKDDASGSGYCVPEVYVFNAITALVNNADSVPPVSSVTTSAGNSPVNSYLYGFDGTNYDRLRLDSAFNLKVNVAASGDPCMGSAKTPFGFGATTSGGAAITGTSGKKTYICNMDVGASAGANVLLIEGTGSSICTGGTTGVVWGGTIPSGSVSPSTSNGWPLTANGGVVKGNGAGTVASSANTGNNVCLAFTTTNSPYVVVSGNYVQQ